jgi:hypothetical protein
MLTIIQSYTRRVLFTVGVVILFASCNKTSEYPNIPIADYLSLKTGQSFVYQLDSLVYTNFGTKDTIRSYQVKFLVDSLIQDNLNRPAYRVFRFIRKQATDQWTPDATCWAIATTDQFEWVENNLRFIKLRRPIENGFSWKGNAFIDTYSTNSSLRYMDNWNYTYDSIGSPYTIGNLAFDETITIRQRDEIIGTPEDPDGYHEINQSVEKYAKGVGLIYKNFFHKEYQPNNGGYVADGSYGITLTLIQQP